MKEKRRCSILFHLRVPGGRWLTTMSRPSWLASFCNSRFHSRTREPLLPPPPAFAGAGLAVIAAQAGGSHGGGAALTPFGMRLIDQYRAIEAEAHAATAARLGELEATCKGVQETTPTKSHAAPRRRTIAR